MGVYVGVGYLQKLPLVQGCWWIMYHSYASEVEHSLGHRVLHNGHSLQLDPL